MIKTKKAGKLARETKKYWKVWVPHTVLKRADKKRKNQGKTWTALVEDLLTSYAK